MALSRLSAVIDALKELKEQHDIDIAETGEVGSMDMQEVEAQNGWAFTADAEELLNIIYSWAAAQEGQLDTTLD